MLLDAERSIRHRLIGHAFFLRNILPNLRIRGLQVANKAVSQARIRSNGTLSA